MKRNADPLARRQTAQPARISAAFAFNDQIFTGPFSIEIVEPFKTLKMRLDKHATDVEYDLTSIPRSASCCAAAWMLWERAILREVRHCAGR